MFGLFLDNNSKSKNHIPTKNAFPKQVLDILLSFILIPLLSHELDQHLGAQK